MIGLLQRVTSASVRIADREVAAIGQGLLVLVGVQRGDSEVQTQRLLERILGYRVFPDSQGRMNRSLRDIEGGLLLVPQFTLAADTAKGTRASLGSAADPDTAKALYATLVQDALRLWPQTGSGEFGADMQVALVNDGPVTFWLEAGKR